MQDILKTTVAAAAAVAVVAGLATTAGATPPATGCPTGHTHRSLTYFAELSPIYHAPFEIDAEGNGDGFVCALELPDGYKRSVERQIGHELPVPLLFLLSDNDSPAAG